MTYEQNNQEQDSRSETNKGIWIASILKNRLKQIVRPNNDLDVHDVALEKKKYKDLPSQIDFTEIVPFLSDLRRLDQRNTSSHWKNLERF